MVRCHRMKALKLKDGSGELVEVSAPSPGATDVVVDVAAVGMSAADLAAAGSGVTPGRFFAGSIAAIGPAVAGSKSATPWSRRHLGRAGCVVPVCVEMTPTVPEPTCSMAGFVPALTLMVGPRSRCVWTHPSLRWRPTSDLAVAALASDVGVHSLHAVRSAGDTITAGNTVAVLGAGVLAAYTAALLEATTGVEVLRISDYSAENQQRLLTEFAYDGNSGQSRDGPDSGGLRLRSGDHSDGWCNRAGEQRQRRSPGDPGSATRYEVAVRAIEYGTAPISSSCSSCCS